MNIILLGYMASGKSLIGQKLADKLNWEFIDLDSVISVKEDMSVSDIFKSRGELYFRKVESKYLEETLLKHDECVLALGGGTPCYGNNMTLINNMENTTSIYLNVAIPELTKRLFREKDSRPLVAHISNINEMTEFVGKHIFERLQFYNQANLRINANLDLDEIVEAIVLELF